MGKQRKRRMQVQNNGCGKVYSRVLKRVWHVYSMLHKLRVHVCVGERHRQTEREREPERGKNLENLVTSKGYTAIWLQFICYSGKLTRDTINIKKTLNVVGRWERVYSFKTLFKKHSCKWSFVLKHNHAAQYVKCWAVWIHGHMEKSLCFWWDWTWIQQTNTQRLFKTNKVVSAHSIKRTQYTRFSWTGQGWSSSDKSFCSRMLQSIYLLVNLEKKKKRCSK